MHNVVETLATQAACFTPQQAAFWLPVHVSNLSPWAVHCPVWLSCSSIYFGCLPRKEHNPQKCSWILQRGNRSTQVTLKSK